jgi:Luciferase
MSEYLRKLEEEVSAWPRISVHPHRFGGKEFLFGSAEVGHMHEGGIVDIPFPRAVRNALLAAGLAEQHHWVPNSGWVTFHVRNEEEDLSQALWLLRLSYLRYALKAANDPRAMLEQESAELNLSPELKSLLERFVPKTANHSATEPLSAA